MLLCGCTVNCDDVPEITKQYFPYTKNQVLQYVSNENEQMELVVDSIKEFHAGCFSVSAMCACESSIRWFIIDNNGESFYIPELIYTYGKGGLVALVLSQQIAGGEDYSSLYFDKPDFNTANDLFGDTIKCATLGKYKDFTVVFNKGLVSFTDTITYQTWNLVE